MCTRPATGPGLPWRIQRFALYGRQYWYQFVIKFVKGGSYSFHACQPRILAKGYDDIWLLPAVVSVLGGLHQCSPSSLFIKLDMSMNIGESFSNIFVCHLLLYT